MGQTGALRALAFVETFTRLTVHSADRGAVFVGGWWSHRVSLERPPQCH